MNGRVARDGVMSKAHPPILLIRNRRNQPPPDKINKVTDKGGRVETGCLLYVAEDVTEYGYSLRAKRSSFSRKYCTEVSALLVRLQY